MSVGRRELAAGAALALALVTELRLFVALVDAGDSLGRLWPWLPAHLVASAVAAAALSALLARFEPGRPRRMFALAFTLAATVPLLGALGAAAALSFGLRRATAGHRERAYWRFTPTPALPFTPPAERRPVPSDGRGVAERLSDGGDHDALYREVLAIGRIRTALSVEALTAAIAHPDERVRLTAYQTLDRKVSALNDDIQRLEALAAGLDGPERSNAWLQVAGNYWELLTLEQGEPVAREQLLARASEAALRAVLARPDNRNACFTLGRVALRQGHPERARVAFERATELGMPKETTLPYLAEAAFDRRELDRVAALLGDIDEAFLDYPPLREVARQWC